MDLLHEIGYHSNDIKSITLSIYRLADDSDVIRLLVYLKQKGVDVKVFIEPSARGDEEHNIYVAHQLKILGINVIIGKSSKKIHAKFIQIHWKKDPMTSIILTGNLNEDTAKCYEDYCLITSDPEITDPLQRYINDLQDGLVDTGIVSNKVCFTKLNAVSTLIKYIDQEQKKGDDGYILIKCNSITDPTMILLLEHAANQGCHIDIICRGECCWKPISNNVHVHRFIHKYLEHSRVYVFGKNHPAVYIGSLDLATHKLYERFELLCRVMNELFVHEILHVMHTMLEDDTERHYDLITNDQCHWYQMRGDSNASNRSSSWHQLVRPRTTQTKNQRSEKEKQKSPEAKR